MISQRSIAIAVGTFTMLLASAFAQLAGSPQFDMSWHTIDGGGGALSASGFTLQGTIGQPDAGITMTSGAFTLTGGFWSGVPHPVDTCPGDLTGNSQIDVDDLLMVVNDWGACDNPCPPACAADIAPPGGNCVVNVDDLLTVINSWGPCK